MDVLIVFSIIAAIIFIGFISELIFKEFNIPDVIILIGVGILLSNFFKIISPENFGEGVKLFTTFALVFLLFQGALGIDFKVLFKSFSKSALLTLLNFILTVIVVTIVSYFLFEFTILQSLLVGMILGGTSSAVVIPLVNNVSIKEKYGTVLTLESALSDVLCIIGTLTVIKIIQDGQFIISDTFRNILTSFLLAIFIGAIVGIIWVYLMDKSEIISKSYMLTIALLIGLYSFVESDFVKASGAIAALSFGLILGNSKSILHIFNRKRKDDENSQIRGVLSFSAKNFYSEISFFVKTIFFVYLGILIDFSEPKVFLLGGLLVLVIYLVRPLAVKIVFNKKLPDKEKAFLEVLIPKGLAAAVLAGVVIQSQVLSPEKQAIFVNTILSVILLSILFTSFLVFLVEKDLFKGFFSIFTKKRKVKSSK